MKTYTIIRSDEQYMDYCNDLEKLSGEYQSNPPDELLDIIDSITLFIEKYDEENSQMKSSDPIKLLKSLMKENGMTQKDLGELLRLSKGHVSDILNYKKGLSKNVIRSLSNRFNVGQKAFNRSYKLKAKPLKRPSHSSLMNSEKNMQKI